MTVEELIEELQRQPNQRVVVNLEVQKRDGNGKPYLVLRPVDYVRFDGGCVVLERER